LRPQTRALMPRAELLGAVLAGGRSRRFGRDKSLALVAGRPLVERAVEALQEVVDDVVVVTSRELSPALEPLRISDEVPDAGPLGGLHAALRAAADRGRDGVLLLACDMPLVTPALLEAVAKARDRAAIVAPRRADGIEPLCAAYHVSLLEQVDALLSGPDRSLHRLFAEAGGVALDLGSAAEGGASPFLSVNEPADRDRAEALLGGSA